MNDPLFGDRLRSALDQAGYSINKATKELNLSKNAITNYVGGRVPEAPILNKLANLCSVSMEWLLTGEDIPVDNLMLYKTHKNKDEFLQMVGRVLKNYANTEKKEDEDIIEASYKVSCEPDYMQEKVSNYTEYSKAKTKQIEVTEEEEALVETYRNLMPKDKEEIQMLMQFKSKNAVSFKKKGRSLTSTHGEEAATKLNA